MKKAEQTIIGLTGPYCAGKNHVARLLENRGLAVLDLDRLGYRAIEEERAAILDCFGRSVLDGKGAVDRRRLGERVFGKPEELRSLEAIVHPVVDRMTAEWMDSRQGPWVLNAAVLHKSAYFSRLDCLILVEAPLPTRLLRARKRDRLSWISLLKRFTSQRNFTSQYLRLNADIYRVENRGLGIPHDQGKLEARIDEILSGEGIR
ncbi:MAG: dephospho-CoA kinase [Treponema sp.]|jgi:dephospho-CoA kinase|nr:dephospho-CoA kinase [Treponema sp.]